MPRWQFKTPLKCLDFLRLLIKVDFILLGKMLCFAIFKKRSQFHKDRKKLKRIFINHFYIDFYKFSIIFSDINVTNHHGDILYNL